MSENLDLAFAMDCTGSMDKFIKSATENIHTIATKISGSGADDLRFALVEYRDHPPQERSFVTRKHEFTTSVPNVKLWLSQSKADGGGDTPEAVADALYDVLNLKWRSDATKICILISDAPPHGLNKSDSFMVCPAGHDPVVIARQMARKGIVLYTVGCEPSINQWKDFFMAIAFMTGGQYVALSNAQILTEVIVGSAQEELSLDKWMTEVDEEVQRDIDDGKEIDEEELSRKIHEKMILRGARAKKLKRKNKKVGEISRRAKMMSKCKQLSEARDFPPEGSYIPDPDIDSWEGGTDGYDIEEGNISMEQAERLVRKSNMRYTTD